MTDAKKRKVYWPEYKAKVGLDAIQSMKTISHVAQEYSVHPILVGLRKKEILEKAQTLLDGGADHLHGFLQR